MRSFRLLLEHPNVKHVHVVNRNWTLLSIWRIMEWNFARASQNWNFRLETVSGIMQKKKGSRVKIFFTKRENMRRTLRYLLLLARIINFEIKFQFADECSYYAIMGNFLSLLEFISRYIFGTKWIILRLSGDIRVFGNSL